MKPTKDQLEKVLTYDPKSGKLFWKDRSRSDFHSYHAFRVFQGRYANKEAFTADTRGYKTGRVFGTQFFAHKIIWAMAYNEWPSSLDHIDGDRSNNKIENLRPVTQKENCRNSSIPVNNTSGHIGVSWIKRLNAWTAQIKVDQVKRHLGVFKNFDDAVKARKDAEAKFGFHKNHGKRIG